VNEGGVWPVARTNTALNALDELFSLNVLEVIMHWGAVRQQLILVDCSLRSIVPQGFIQLIRPCGCIVPPLPAIHK
jgi:hypothetical protein